MAEGNVKDLLDQMNKASQQLKKAKEQIAGSILDIADSLDACVVKATAIGGKISQIIPPHVQANIDKLTAEAEQIANVIEAVQSAGGQSSLDTLVDTIRSMPVSETMPETAEDRRAKRSGSVNLTPDTSSGPQSQAMKEAFRGRLSWNKLTESGMFGSSGDDDFGLSEFTQKKNPIDSFSYKQKMREMIERDDLEDLGTHIQESMDGKGHFDWKRMNSLSGTADFKNMDFSSLKSTGRDGTDLRDITVLG